MNQVSNISSDLGEDALSILGKYMRKEAVHSFSGERKNHTIFGSESENLKALKALMKRNKKNMDLFQKEENVSVLENTIAEFRNVPKEYFMPRFKNISTFDYLAETGLQKYKGNEELYEQISGNWERIVGKTFANRCRPKQITSDKVLEIAVATPVLKSELEFKQLAILKQLKQLKGCQDFIGVQIILG